MFDKKFLCKTNVTQRITLFVYARQRHLSTTPNQIFKVVQKAK